MTQEVAERDEATQGGGCEDERQESDEKVIAECAKKDAPVQELHERVVCKVSRGPVRRRRR